METARLLEILASYNRFWTTGHLDAGIRRDLLPQCLSQVDTKEIVVLKGVRRCGKSTLLAQVMDALLQGGIRPQQLLRVNLEEPLFTAEASVELLEQIYRTWRERVCPEGKGYLFLDEIQNIPGWEGWVRGRSDTEDVKIFVTGSSAQMLSREIGTKLTGRQVSFEVYPLSFSEFLRFKGVEVQSELEYISNKTLIRHHFFDYLKYGGFPEVALRQDDADRELLLKNYFEDILYRDIVTRHEIRDVANLRNLAVFLLTNNTKPTSLNKLKGNFSISQDKTENYLSAILESYLTFQLQRFSWSLKSVQRAGFKPYAIDTGLRNRVAFSFSAETGRLVENVVHNHLRRCHEEIYFAIDGGETDFIVKEGLKIVRRIQVWYEDAPQSEIPERELAAFEKLQGDDAECLLLTNDLEKDTEIGPTKVRCLPVVKYLLLGK
ncbi:ATP-binding protein [Geoalkalibacter subterraneus]|uniref:ATPase n=1 Tax=Geoalkalibacter subterraneus TaxID=483547 RepID=A0A0B5FSP3_9BACT|nr:ATP-binding protein [Geoalkalibacter subterraneus]AJF06611.1 ATPase [Geoalkalibacter subterraneus]